MDEPETLAGLICAFQLDGKGGGTPLDWDGVYKHEAKNGALWVHLDYRGEDARIWLREKSGLDEIACSALLAKEPRPRCVESKAGVLLILRGVNLNEGAQPEDMVSMRMWVDRQRIITLRHRRNMAAKALRQDIRAGKGPANLSEFVVELIEGLLEGIALVTDQLDDAVAVVESEVLESENYELRHQLAVLRRRAISLRRHVAPEREVLSRLQAARAPWLREIDRTRLRECADRMTRIIEDLEAARERAAVTQEEVASRLSELMNRRLYVLSVAAAIFLPLGMITGLWGVNAGGVPLQSNPWGFFLVALMMAALAAVLIAVFRMKRWL